MALDLLGGLGTGTSILGSITKAFGQFQTSKEVQLVNELNAAVARANASAIMTSGEFDVLSLQKRKKRLISAQKAGYSKSGVRLEGSPIEVMIDSAAQYETDILISKYNTKVQEISANLIGQVSGIQAKTAKTTGKLNMASTLLSTASSFFGGLKPGYSANVSGKGVLTAPPNYYLKGY